MASKICVSCLRAISYQSRFVAPSRKQTASVATSRKFTTNSRRCISRIATPATSIPPVTPKVGEGGRREPPATEFLAQQRKIGGITETYTAYGGTEALYKECVKQADYSVPQAADADVEVPKTEDGEDLGIGGGWWHNEAGLKPTFSTWSQVTMLHIYLLTARFRKFPPDVCKIWQQHILDHFFYDMENKMVINHAMNARGTRNKYLKDIFIQWRGVLAAYDEGLAKNDAVLAAAVWRNVFKGSEDVDIAKLAQIVSFMRRTLSNLDAIDDMRVMQAKMEFSSPSLESSLVTGRSKMMTTDFGKDAPVKPVKSGTSTKN